MIKKSSRSSLSFFWPKFWIQLLGATLFRTFTFCSIWCWCFYSLHKRIPHHVIFSASATIFISYNKIYWNHVLDCSAVQTVLYVWNGMRSVNNWFQKVGKNNFAPKSGFYQHSFFHRLYRGVIFLVYYFYYITSITIEIYKGEDSMEWKWKYETYWSEFKH